MKTLSGRPGERSLRSTLVLATCGAAASPPPRELSSSALRWKLGSGIYRSGLESGPAPGGVASRSCGRHFGVRRWRRPRVTASGRGRAAVSAAPGPATREAPGGPDAPGDTRHGAQLGRFLSEVDSRGERRLTGFCGKSPHTVLNLGFLLLCKSRFCYRSSD